MPDGTGGGNGESSGAKMTADGTGVFFQTSANNLGTDDAGFDEDVYFRDLVTGSTALVSANAAGTDGGNDYSEVIGISADGSTLLYSSSADDLGPADPGNEQDIYVAPAPPERAGHVHFAATGFAVDESAGSALVTVTRTNGARGYHQRRPLHQRRLRHRRRLHRHGCHRDLRRRPADGHGQRPGRATTVSPKATRPSP